MRRGRTEEVRPVLTTRSQLEMLNVFMGFEQANKYAIYSTDGNLVA
jgi:hypothetical protein